MDNALARGIGIVLLWVLVGLSLLVLVVAILIWIVGIGPRDSQVSFLEGLWIALTRSLDPGTFGADEGPRFRLAGLIVTLGGLFALAVLIGLVSSAIDRRLDELRRGRSVVVERGHTLILGHSRKLPIVVRELIEAHADSTGASIVILTRNDKVELEDSLRRELPDRRGIRIVVRRGDPAHLPDLEQVRPKDAASVIILRPDEEAADARVVRVALAVQRARVGLPSVPVVAELSDPATARALRQALPGAVMTVVSGEVIARIAAQTSRSSGLGSVYEELLDFAGDEVYIVDAPPQAVGRRFGEAMLLSEHSTLIGLIREDGTARLCPEFDIVIGRGDRLVLVAEDGSSIAFEADCPEWDKPPDAHIIHADRRIENTLVIGWNDVARRIVEELDHHVLPGSTLDILIDPSISVEFAEADLSALQNQDFRPIEGVTIDREVIEKVFARGPFHHIIVLCPHEDLPPVEADARSLLTLMHIRNLLDAQPTPDWGRTNVITEVMQAHSVEIAQVARPDDFIVSQRLVSLIMTQLAENPLRKAILEEILGAEGVQVCVRSALDFVGAGEYSFDELIRETRDHGVIVLGWYVRSQESRIGADADGLRINPSKAERVQLGPEDRLVLLLEP